MRLLIDNQLPAALARYLQSRGWDAIHVSDVGLECSADSVIWRYATDHNLVIVTKDQDFQMIAQRQTQIPPQVLWVRLGNCRRPALFDAFAHQESHLRQVLRSGAFVVELR
ncbi:DUF5615 family PIN-like protein [Massilia agilis]|uniref:DUF5615 family PIN-like protein n=1 Tax=Massilia agilis TaxID=1811226 RepID=UPI00351D51BF